MAKLGDTRVYKGQFYTAVETLERIRRDGSTALVLRWISSCAECGAPFEITTPAASSKFEPSRRCQKHKRPGQPVKRLPQ